MGGQARGDQRATDGVGDAALTDDLDRWRCGYCGALKAIPSMARECFMRHMDEEESVDAEEDPRTLLRQDLPQPRRLP